MLVLEIGTGGGMLALMAARAGAEHVVTCEMDPVLAEVAREMIAANGFGDRVTVVPRAVARADRGGATWSGAPIFWFCDIFGNSLLDFFPLTALTDARRRLVTEDAAVMPSRVRGVRLALANWNDWRRMSHAGMAGGFDLGPFRDFVSPWQTIAVDDPGLRLLSAAQDAFRFDFAAAAQAATGETALFCEAHEAGEEVNGIARWIRLELDDDTFLEARPNANAKFFSALTFTPLPAPLAVKAGEVVRVHASYQGNVVHSWIA